jgi:hypothetical protein
MATALKLVTTPPDPTVPERADPSDGYAPTTFRPSLRQFLELPVIVQHDWQNYVVVDAALQDLEQGNFLSASLLTDAVYTDSRTSGIIATRQNAAFALPMEWKYRGQEDDEKADSDQPEQDDKPEDSEEVVELKKQILAKAKKNWQKMLPSSALKEMFRWGLFVNAGVAELVWSWDQNDEFYPTLKTWNSQFLYWRWDTRSYWIIHEGGQTEVYPGDGRWVLFAPTGHNHGWLYGLIRCLGKIWIDLQFSYRDWSRASEKWSCGIVVATMPEGASKESKQQWENAVTNMPNEGTVLAPVTKEGHAFDLHALKSDTMTGWENFQKRIEQLHTDAAIATLGQNLTTEIRGSSGSRAAETRASVFTFQ